MNKLIMVDFFEGNCFSTVHSLCQLHGDEEKIRDVRKFVKKAIGKGLTLYDAQSSCRNYFIEKYGVGMYEKSAEAIQFIVEEEYATLEREKTSDAFYYGRAGVL